MSRKNVVLQDEQADPITQQSTRRYFGQAFLGTRVEMTQSAIGTTTNATLTTIQTIPLNDNSVYLIHAFVVGRRTGGSAGTAGDGAVFERVGAFRRNAAGNVVQIGTTNALATFKDQAAWDCQLNVSTTTVVVQIAGALNNNVSWMSRVVFQKINA